MSTPNIDDVAQTLAEYERLAIGTGATVRIDPPEFSDGSTPLIGTGWSPFWTAEAAPAVARVTVYRDGTPTTVYVAWAESFPAEESWRALWLAKPMKLFGAYVVRAALRRAFRDAIGDRREPDEQQTLPTPAAQVPSQPADAVDWFARVEEATTVTDLKAVRGAAREATAVTLPLKKRIDERLVELGDAAWGTIESRSEPGAPLTPEAKPGTPRDYLPPAGNRAARRANARKKGGKR